jgi:S1-C subfamily serine protease
MKQTISLAVVLALVSGSALALAEAPADVVMARKTLETYGNAIVYVTAVATISSGSRSREQKTRAIGTVIDARGLTVVSNSSLDPAGAIGSMRTGGAPVTLKSELGDVKIRMADGTEVPAKVVLKDDDLDLAFVAPAKAPDAETRKKFAVVNLGDAATEAVLLDRIIGLGRAGKDLNYTATLSLGRVSAVVTKPRTVYIGARMPGAPVFAGNGKILGICIMRRSPSGGTYRRFMRQPVILPAADIREIAEQAREELKE